MDFVGFHKGKFNSTTKQLLSSQERGLQLHDSENTTLNAKGDKHLSRHRQPALADLSSHFSHFTMSPCLGPAVCAAAHTSPGTESKSYTNVSLPLSLTPVLQLADPVL